MKPSKRNSDVSAAEALGCLIPIALVPIALVVAAQTTGIPQKVAGAVLFVLFVWGSLIALDRDPVAAWQNERLSELKPWLNRNEDIGRKAEAISSFRSEDGVTTGEVTINGEYWAARCLDGSTINKGDSVYIVARDGLVVDVSPSLEGTGIELFE